MSARPSKKTPPYRSSDLRPRGVHATRERSPAMPAGFPEIIETGSNKSGVDKMERGLISRWNISRGFGFIFPDDGGRNVFVHFSAIRNRTPEEVREGDKIEFDYALGKDGRTAAANARIIDPPGTECAPIRFADEAA